MKDSLRMEQISITPELAAEWLKGADSNRSLDKSRVRKYVRSMKDGRWHPATGEAIKRTSDGKLVDGQHRLHSVIASGVTISFTVITGVPEDAFKFIDVGKSRTLKDLLTIEGTSRASTIAGAGRMVYDYLNGYESRLSVYTGNADLLEFIQGRPELIASTVLCDSRYRNKVMGSSMMGAIHYLGSQKDRELATTFVEQISFGEGLSKTDPVFRLRERLVNDRISKSKLPPKHILALSIKAWNFTRKGKTVSRLEWRGRGEAGEPFPKFE